MSSDLDQLAQLALSLGANQARLMDSDKIIIQDQLALKCIEPGCENYGLSYSCPPYVEGPTAFRNLITSLRKALVLRLIVPSSMLLSWERTDLGRILHELVATIEMEAKNLGFSRSIAFAGDSCKKLFCGEHLYCRRIEENKSCRNPGLARPSMSGYGIDVYQLIRNCGWETNLNQNQNISREDQLSWMAGLILIG